LKNRFLLPWFPLWALPVLIGLAIGTVWLRLAIVRTTYEISQTDTMIRHLQQDREQQELQVTGLRSPRRLESIAKAKFGLSQPRAEQVIPMKAVMTTRSSSSAK
jgi:cell division protein FtsL